MRKAKGDVFFWHPSKRKIIAWSSEATNNFLIMLHEDNPEATIHDLKILLNEPSKCIFLPEENAVLDAYINAGLENHVPNWGVNEFPTNIDWSENKREFSQKCMDIAWGRDTTTMHKELRNIYKGKRNVKK